LLVLAGLRADPYARSVSRAWPQVGKSPTMGVFAQDFAIEPRISARFTSGIAHTTLAYGRYGQSPAAADLSSAFGNPALPAADGTHYVLAAGVDPTDAASIEATGFLTTTEGLAVRNPAEQPARAEALVAEGSGRSYGAQVTAKLDPVRGYGGFVSYTLSWSERRDGEGAKWRPSDYDQRHVLTAVGSATLPLDIQVGLRTRVSSGFPRTEVLGAYYDARRDLWQPLFGEHNEIRIPTFFQADLRVSRGFDIGYTTLELSFEVQNLTNAKNVEEFVYSADYSERGAIVGLPIFPVLGARWTF
jgi:hypothetical protein